MSTSKYFSILTPTYNAEKYLRLYFESLVMQTFPRDQFEILIIDGGSQDETLRIVEEYSDKLPVRILDNPFRNAEHGKKIGFDASSGEVVVLLDSDNEVTSPSWLSEAYELFESQKKLWGLESHWFEKQGDKAISKYFASMNYCDPVARLFAPRATPTMKGANYELYEANTKDTPVIGANGFFWKRSVIGPYLLNKEAFEETNLVAQLILDGFTTYGKLTSSGIYHYYVSSIEGYFHKRIKIARKFMQRKAKGQRTWVDKAGFSKLIISSIYNISIIGPLSEALYHIFKKKQLYWLYHPLICFMTVIIYADNFLRRVQNLLISVFVFIFIFVLYSPLFGSHFQQDEWHNIGWHIYNIGEYGYWGALSIAATSWIPVTQVYNFFSYTIFGTKLFSDVIFLFSLLFLNIYLLITLLSYFSKSKLILAFSAFLLLLTQLACKQYLGFFLLLQCNLVYFLDYYLLSTQLNFLKLTE
jgi:glycosyltransferase involved in cell wall biosynthesis